MGLNVASQKQRLILGACMLGVTLAAIYFMIFATGDSRQHFDAMLRGEHTVALKEIAIMMPGRVIKLEKDEELDWLATEFRHATAANSIGLREYVTKITWDDGTTMRCMISAYGNRRYLCIGRSKNFDFYEYYAIKPSGELPAWYANLLNILSSEKTGQNENN